MNFDPNWTIPVHDYGVCEDDKVSLVPRYALEKEHDSNGALTGRWRRICDCLVCPCCGAAYAVDERFDGEWHTDANMPCLPDPTYRK